MNLVWKKNRVCVLCATSCIALSVCLTQEAFAQTDAPNRGSEAATLPPVVVQSPTAKRAKPNASQRANRSRLAAGNSRNTGRGNAPSAAASGAGAGTRQAESAWGHVDGYVATRSASGTKTDTPLIETPAAISVITQGQIQAQAAQNIPQAVRYTSGTRGETSGADTRFDYVYVRGFQADLYLDGMRLFTGSFATPIIEPYNLERVEVLHGPASVLYGQASPGGLVDMVSKRPTDEPYHEMFLSTGSYGRIQGGVDLSGPIDQNKEWLYRFTASGFDVGSQVDFARYQRVSIAPSLTWRPDTDTTVTFLGTYQNDPKAGFYNQLPAKGYGTLFPLASGQFIPTSFYPGVPNVDQMSRELGQVGYLAEHRFDNVWTVRQNLRYSDLSSAITTIYPIGASTTDPNSIARSGFFENEKLRTFDLDNQAEAKFALGPFSHTMLFGLDYQNGNFNYTNGAPPAGFSVPSISVANPFYATPIPMVSTGTSRQNFDQFGVYAQDQIKLDRWVALLGVRWDEADSSTQSLALATGTTTTTRLSNDATTKRAALLYKFDNGVAPYIQYTESFQPQTGIAFGGGPFQPTTGQQEEAGIKYQPNAKSLYTLAAFNLTQQNVLTPDPSHTGFNVQTGEIRSRGIELEGKTEIDRSLSLLASYTYLDDVITKSNMPYAAGRRPVGMPTNSAALWADYTFRGGRLDGFGVAGGIRYLGDTAGNITGTTVLDVPGVTLFDAAVHYDLAGLGPQFKGYFLQVNASNLFDKTYVTLCQDNGCYYGLRRQVLATLRYRW
ncbi:MAG: TonB-dependent siderophore receptor [Bradyrhizobium sp.]|nr:TonB-dependent siderophore receptor [Bradyrhizobium sp.]MEA2867545.1 iron complex outerrane recepter protein [Bradyrhizobium sp.]